MPGIGTNSLGSKFQTGPSSLINRQEQILTNPWSFCLNISINPIDKSLKEANRYRYNLTHKYMTANVSGLVHVPLYTAKRKRTNNDPQNTTQETKN